jgi:Clostripain family
MGIYRTGFGIGKAVRVVAGMLIAASLIIGPPGCGEKKKTTAPVTPVATSITAYRGVNQTAASGTAVATNPSVIVKDGNGNAFAGTTVTFSVASGGGSITGATATSNAQGIATVGSWILGSTAGTNTLTATATDLSGSPVTFVATGTSSELPEWTLMVYLAADNTLAVAGLQDINEMEAANPHPDVNVVVEVEFSQNHLQQAGCDLSCINLPNWNTYRYLVTGAGTEQIGINGTAQDIGSRNMADPNELREFVTWAKQTYPAQRYALVLWNHGGGYTGLIEDQTDGGHDLMSLTQLKQALTGLGQIDLVDFDMCLMGAYETMDSMQGLADYVVFSEEVVPGAGNPYEEVVNGIQQYATASTRTVAEMFVNRFHESYTETRSSTTKSAYDMASYQDFKTSFEALAATLRASLGTLSPAIAQAAGNAQSYSYKQLKDLVDFLILLKQATTDPTLHGQIDGVIAATTGSFRVANQVQNGGGGSYGEEPDVVRSTGIHVLMPSGAATDQLPASGSGSFSAYQSLYAGNQWTLFLTDWLSGATTTPTQDQGDNVFETFLVWATEAVATGVDIDLMVLEPDGNIYAPYMGPVTPNGFFTDDSYANGENLEGYQLKSSVAEGDYFFLANLYADPLGYQPAYDMVYRFGTDAEYQSYFSGNYPYLSFDSPWQSDPTPSWEELFEGAYSDLQFVMYFTVGPVDPVASRFTTSPDGIQGRQAKHGPQLTGAQIETLRNLIQSKTLRTQSSAGYLATPSLIEFVPGGQR